eukprot:365661-Chlamydomonas_euryale.AAC.17
MRAWSTPSVLTFFAAGDFNGGALSAGTLAVASSDGDVAPALASAALTSDAFSAFGEPDLAAALTLCEAFLGEPDALGGDMPLCTAPENSPKRDAIIKDGTVPAGRGSGAVCQGGRWGGGPMLRKLLLRNPPFLQLQPKGCRSTSLQPFCVLLWPVHIWVK